MKQGSHIRIVARAFALVALAALSLVLCACSGGSSSSGSGSADDTSGSPLSSPADLGIINSDFSKAVQKNNAAIDTSHVSKGIIWAKARNRSKLKMQVVNGSTSYNYDLPNDGTPVAYPLNMGDGSYTLRVMQNTGGNNYVEVLATTKSVTLESEFAPFLHPSIFCSYKKGSKCVAKATELAKQASNEADFVRLVYDYICANVSYDTSKAEKLSNATGYTPDPDETLASGKGICFDYAALGAAMMRSQGIPCKVMTGYVSPNGIYHSWNMIYIDGTWTCAEIKISADTWERVDLTFAASKASSSTIGDGTDYTDKYTY